MSTVLPKDSPSRNLFSVALALLLCAAHSSARVTPETQPADELILVNFPDNVELRVLVEYVASRLNINIVCDEQVLTQRVSIKSPASIRRSNLLGLLEGVLQMKGYLLIDGEQAGWKMIVPVTGMALAANPSTQPSGLVSRARLPVVQFFPVKYLDSQKAEQLVKPFLTQPGGSAVAVPDQRLLMVTDYESNVERARELLERLDQPGEAIVLEFVPVEHVEAQQLAGQVDGLLAAKLKAQGTVLTAAPTVEILPDSRTNRLAVIGTSDQVKESIAIIRALDLRLDLVTKAYALQTASPERLDRLVRELVGPVDVKRAYQSVIDKESNRLLVTTTNQLHNRVAALQAELDIPATAQEQSPIRFYKLQNTTATEVLQTIQLIQGYGAIGEITEAPLAPAPPLSVTTPIPGANRPPPGVDQPLPTPPSYQPEQQTGGPTTLPSQTRRSVRAGDAVVTADPNTNTIIVVAPPDVQRIYEQLIRTLDRRRPQVLIEVTIVTLDTSNNFSLGVEISGRASIDDTEIITFSSFGLSNVGTGPNLGRLSLIPGLGFNGTVLSSDVADLVIRALVTSGRAKVVSAPRILVNDNATGTLASVQEAPFTSVNASQTIATTSFAGYASAGTTIALTPHISEADFLALDYTIALNSFTDRASGDETTPPPRQTNQLQSKVTIPDGSTIVVGGLNRRDTSETIDRIPILGRIPIVEYFFSNRRTTDSTSTLFVFIRPVVLRDDQFADLKYFSLKNVGEAGIRGDFPKSEPLLLR